VSSFGYDWDDDDIRREKHKARELRNSEWWKRKCSQGKCYYCGVATPVSGLTMDHIVPLARGGKSTKNNVVPACKDCNNRKKLLLPMEWEEYIHSLNKDENL